MLWNNRVWVLCHYVRMYSERNPTNGPKHVNHRVSIIACKWVIQFQQLSDYSVIRFLWWCKWARCSVDQTYLGLKMVHSMLTPLIWAFSSRLEGHWYIQKVSVPSSTAAEKWDTRRQEDVGDQHPSRSTASCSFGKKGTLADIFQWPMWRSHEMLWRAFWCLQHPPTWRGWWWVGGGLGKG